MTSQVLPEKNQDVYNFPFTAHMCLQTSNTKGGLLSKTQGEAFSGLLLSQTPHCLHLPGSMSGRS